MSKNNIAYRLFRLKPFRIVQHNALYACMYSYGWYVHEIVRSVNPFILHMLDARIVAQIWRAVEPYVGEK